MEQFFAFSPRAQGFTGGTQSQLGLWFAVAWRLSVVAMVAEPLSQALHDLFDKKRRRYRHCHFIVAVPLYEECCYRFISSRRM